MSKAKNQENPQKKRLASETQYRNDAAKKKKKKKIRQHVHITHVTKTDYVPSDATGMHSMSISLLRWRSTQMRYRPICLTKEK